MHTIVASFSLPANNKCAHQEDGGHNDERALARSLVHALEICPGILPAVTPLLSSDCLAHWAFAENGEEEGGRRRSCRSFSPTAEGSC